MSHLEPTQASAEALIARQIDGPITMLKMLRFSHSRLLPVASARHPTEHDD